VLRKIRGLARDMRASLFVSKKNDKRNTESRLERNGSAADFIECLIAKVARREAGEQRSWRWRQGAAEPVD